MGIVWIDWREYDEDIVYYFNDIIKDDKFEIQLVDNGKPYGDDIILKKEDKTFQIPYEEIMERDVTLQYLNDFLKPKYEIRWCEESLGNDTLGFVILESQMWQELKKNFGQDKVRYYFSPINIGRKMFNLDIKEISDLMEARKKQKEKFNF